jgi:hypothetical protein
MAVSQGRVVFSGRAGGMLVVQSEHGFTLVEMLGQEGEVVVGDVVRGDWDAEGSEPLFRGRDRFDAYVQGTWGAPDVPVRMARGG